MERLARNLIMVHAVSVDIYRKEFKQRQMGTIAITLVGRTWKQADVRTLNGWSHSTNLAQPGMLRIEASTCPLVSLPIRYTLAI